MGPVLFVVGPTASGKTALAIALARRFDGEIVNADSRQFYRGMDIGTAKPSPDELAAASHHLIDVLNPDQPSSLAWFMDEAHATIGRIQRRGRLPIVCGGTGQYVRALLEGWEVPRVPPDPALRAGLEERLVREGVAALYADLEAADPIAAGRVDRQNPRRVIRALEVASSRDSKEPAAPAHPPVDRTRVLGIEIEREALYRRIDERVDRMFEAGLVDEVRALNDRGFGCELPSFSAIGYREVCGFLRGDSTLDEARARTKLATHRLVRTQAAWFRRTDPRITWLEVGPDLVERAAVQVQPFLSAQQE